ncbi:MAG: DNA polymerase III subunit delta [Kurthia sp.]|nr:DNA polymerase III subunit delta [Candidatus Kurthia equi]
MAKVYFVHGDEPLLCDEYVTSILPANSEINRYDMRETDVGDIIMDASQVSLFGGENKTLILNNCYFLGSEKALSDKDNARLIEFMNSEDQTVLIFRYPKPDKRKKLYKELMKTATIFEGATKTYPEKWLIDRAKKYNMKLTDPAASKMVLELGTSLYLLDSELIKVSNRYPNAPKITDNMLSDILSRTLESNVFKLIEKIMYRKPDSIDLLQDLLTTGNDEVSILILIARQLRMMEQVKIAQVTKQPNPMKEHHYAIQKAGEQASNYRLEQIQSMLSEVAELDLKFKRGQVDKTIALETLILSWI